MKHVKERLREYYDTSTSLSLMSDTDLIGVLDASPRGNGWGATQVLEYQNRKIFVKRVPLTQREMEHRYSTRNLFRMPAWYNYGVGSAGFGAFRELAAHIKTTSWVLGGEVSSFPLLYHHRILPHTPTPMALDEQQQLDDYSKYWNNSRTIRRYMLERRLSTNVLVLFIEHIPHDFSAWIADNPGKLGAMFRQAIDTVDFLHSKKFIHFDAHAQNWVTDGKDLYLGDFGLVLSGDFEMTSKEREFFNRHRHYDYAQVTGLVGESVILEYLKLDRSGQEAVHEALGETPSDLHGFLKAISNESLALHKTGLLELSRSQRRLLEHYKPVIDTVREFLYEMRFNRQKNTPYPHRRLKRLLKETGIIA